MTVRIRIDAELAGQRAQIVNIGAVGLQVVCETPSETGSIHRLTVDGATATLEASVRVVALLGLGDGGYAMSLAFIGLTHEQRDSIDTLMADAVAE
jgi:hypothetical protein